jgi:hypothetical protein
VRAMGIRDRPTSFHSPWQNGYVERLIGSIRRECTDHLIVFNAEHLRRMLARRGTPDAVVVEGRFIMHGGIAVREYLIASRSRVVRLIRGIIVLRTSSCGCLDPCIRRSPR